MNLSVDAIYHFRQTDTVTMFPSKEQKKCKKINGQNQTTTGGVSENGKKKKLKQTHYGLGEKETTTRADERAR